MADPESFAIVPAAGVSARMGGPKLLLPFDGEALIERVLAAWLASDVSHVVAVVRANDERVLALCQIAGVDLVTVTAPPDMKASVQAGLHYVSSAYAPQPDACWLLAPADLPRLSGAAINAVLHAHNPGNPTVVAPAFQGRRGHPTLLPWALAEEVDRLPQECGINSLLKHMRVREVPWDDDAILRDVDTPRDYAAALNQDSSGDPSRG